MGLFGKLFDKKECSLCGGEIGLLGNRKLEDGNCCKTCAGKLSPWFDDRRHSTVDQIQRQLAAREENRRQLETWNHDLSFGEYQKIYIRRVNGVPESFVITSADNYKQYNTDIIPFKNVASCDVDIEENHTELMRTKENGEEVSYNPPRFEYSYDFYIKLMITGFEYIDDICFKVNRNTLELETTQSHAGRGLPFSQAFDPMHYPEYRELKFICDTISEIVSCGQSGTLWSANGSVNAAPTAAAVQINVPAAPAPQAASWVCEACGSENAGKFCSSCGGKKPAGIPQYKCDKCGWVPSDPTKAPRFCPECGDPFDNGDIV